MSCKELQCILARARALNKNKNFAVIADATCFYSIDYSHQQTLIGIIFLSMSERESYEYR
uniref:Uncharacterized protein n=1 Tax=Physcomitrium patens TaxID=3218 RepID=A0A2K1KL11_PHYPA|nr:hypothetical protein PHYPA_008134 [Physcomitrium patens]